SFKFRAHKRGSRMSKAMFCRRLHDQAQRQGKYPDTSGNQVLNTEDGIKTYYRGNNRQGQGKAVPDSQCSLEEMRTCRLGNMTGVLAWSYWHDAPRTESHSSGRRLQSVSKTQTISKARQGFRQLPMIKTGEW